MYRPLCYELQLNIAWGIKIIVKRCTNNLVVAKRKTNLIIICSLQRIRVSLKSESAITMGHRSIRDRGDMSPPPKKNYVVNKGIYVPPNNYSRVPSNLRQNSICTPSPPVVSLLGLRKAVPLNVLYFSGGTGYQMSPPPINALVSPNQ